MMCMLGEPMFLENIALISEKKYFVAFFKGRGKNVLDITEALQLLPRRYLYLHISLTITLSLVTKKQSNFKCA